MAKKLLHSWIGTHTQVHMHFLHRVSMYLQVLLRTMNVQVCTLNRCCEHQRTHLLHALYRMCICDRCRDMYICVHRHMYMYIFICTCVCVCVCICIHVCMYVYVYVYVYIYMCMHVCVCMCTCICVYVYIYIYIYTYAYIHSCTCST